MELYLRKACALDKKLTYGWLNDKEARANSFNKEMVAYEDHEQWFDKSLADERRQIFIAMNFMMPVGQIRLDYEDDETATISYMVDAESRGLGYGKKLLLLVEKEALKAKPEGVKLVAHVLPANEASIKTFENAGYTRVSNGQDTEIIFEKQVSSKAATKPLAPAKRSRQANFEILRVVAMMMVITLHYIGKGGFINPASASIPMISMPYWILECLCIVSVNVYVLISGYFMMDSRFSLSKLAQLWCQIFFYSLLGTIVAIVSGVASPWEVIASYKQFIIFPAFLGHYWFASAYLVMYILSPLLVKAMASISKRTHQTVILLLLSILCFSKSIIPYQVTFDDQGISFVWFIALFIVAGYIRRYGMTALDKASSCMAIYVASTLGILVYRYLVVALVIVLPDIDLYMRVTDYNFILVFTGALGLFGFFKNLKIKDNAITRFIVKIAPYTFGVYLLHEHILIRYSWLSWLSVNADRYGKLRILHLVFCILVIMAVGILVDFVRKLIFDLATKVIIWGLGIYYSAREVWDYLIFGVLATIVNWIAYIFCGYVLLVPFLGAANESNPVVAGGVIDKIIASFTSCASLSNIIAWVVAVLFAYWTNRHFVFHSQAKEFKAVMKEFSSFIGARVFSFVVEQALFILFVGTLRLSDIISKIIISVVVIILNYIFSKLFVFKGEKKS